MRRSLIVAILISVLIAGCAGTSTSPATTPDSSTSEPTSEQVKWDSPFESNRAIVAVNDTTNSSKNFTYAASEALQYWNNHIEEYGKYDAHFDFQPNATDPDIVLRHAEKIECPQSEWSGCAPIPNKNTSFSDVDSPHVVDNTVLVRIEDSSYGNWRIDRNNIIHEIGHVLGLNHYDHPLWVMAPAGRGIPPEVRDAKEAQSPWRDASLRVFVQTKSLTDDQQSQVVNATKKAIDYYNSGAEGYRPQELELQLVDSAYRADIVVKAGTNTTSGVDRWGRSVDRDDEFEYFVRGVIYVNNSDLDRSYGIVGRMLAYLTRPNAVPPEFDHLQAS